MSIESIIPKDKWDKFFSIIGYYMDDRVLYELTPGRYTYSPIPIDGVDNKQFLGWLRGFYIAIHDDNMGILGSNWVVLMSYDENVPELMGKLRCGDYEAYDIKNTLEADPRGYHLGSKILHYSFT